MKRMFVILFLLVGITTNVYSKIEPKVLDDLYFCVKTSHQSISDSSEIYADIYAGLKCDKVLEDLVKLEISDEEISNTINKAIKEISIQDYIQCKKENYLSDKDFCESELLKAKKLGATDEEIKKEAGELAVLMGL